MAELTQTINQANEPFGFSRIASEKSPVVRGELARKVMPEVMRESQTAERGVMQAERDARLKQAQEGTKVEQTFQRGIESAQQTLQQQSSERPERNFSEFDPKAGIELAALTAILGSFAGAVSGRAALQAMKGVTEGYRLGQQDLYEKSTKQFESELQKHREKLQNAQQNYQLAQQAEQAKRGAGVAKLREFAPELSGSLGEAHLRNNDIKSYKNYLDEWSKFTDQMFMKAEEAKLKPVAQTIKTAQVKGSDNKNYLVDVNTFPFGSDPSNVNTKGVIGEAAIKTAEAGSRERTFAQRVFGSIKGMAVDAKNLLTLPSTAAMPEFAGITAEDPNSIFRALIAMTARTITEPEKRAFQQITEQIAQAMANIEGQGLASGATAAKVKAFDALRPKEGDNAINMALYFARVRQELETGIEVFLTNTGANEEQKRQAQEILNNLPKQIPFTVEDVFRKVPGSQQKLSQEMDRLIRQSPVLTELESPEQTTAQGPREGDESTSRSGKPIVFTNGKWEYK
jgi:hypothetical protein